MATITALPEPAASTLLSRFGLKLRAIEPLTAGSVNSNFRCCVEDGPDVFLRIYEEQDDGGAEAELRLLHALVGAGVRTTRPLSTTDGQLLVNFAGKPVAVYPWMVGTLLCQATVTPEHCTAVGRALADVHLASHGIAAPAGRFGPEALRNKLATIRREHPRFGADVETLTGWLDAALAEQQPVPMGITHGDLFRDNVLWPVDGEPVLIDFESACYGRFSYDIAVTLLAWCFSDEFEASLIRALLSGYESRRPLSAVERAALMPDAVLACVRFATTRIVDFSLRCPEGATPSRDYRRFMARKRQLSEALREASR